MDYYLLQVVHPAAEKVIAMVTVAGEGCVVLMDSASKIPKETEYLHTHVQVIINVTNVGLKRALKAVTAHTYSTFISISIQSIIKALLKRLLMSHPFLLLCLFLPPYSYSLVSSSHTIDSSIHL